MPCKGTVLRLHGRTSTGFGFPSTMAARKNLTLSSDVSIWACQASWSGGLGSGQFLFGIVVFTRSREFVFKLPLSLHNHGGHHPQFSIQGHSLRRCRSCTEFIPRVCYNYIFSFIPVRSYIYSSDLIHMCNIAQLLPNLCLSRFS